jgi:hypothetical protein
MLLVCGFQRLKNSQVENSPTRSTRNNPVQENDLFVKQIRLVQSAQNPLIMVARIFNKLPEVLKSEVNKKSFERRLKKILKDSVFYDIRTNSCSMTLTNVTGEANKKTDIFQGLLYLFLSNVNNNKY